MTSSVKPLTWIVGALLTLAGFAGLVWQPALLTLRMDTVLSLFTLIVGLLGIWAVATEYAYAKIYLVSFGIIYAVIAVIGWINKGNLYVTTVNTPDTILHIVLAVVLLVVGLSSSGSGSATPVIPEETPIA